VRATDVKDRTGMRLWVGNGRRGGEGHCEDIPKESRRVGEGLGLACRLCSGTAKRLQKAKEGCSNNVQ
jgi:hypothetical protein